MLVVPARESCPLTQCAQTHSGVPGGDRGLPVSGEGIGTVVHHRGVVVCYSIRVGIGRAKLEELALKTITDVVVVDCDVTIPIWPALFVPSAQCVEYLVHHDAPVLTSITNGDILSTTNTTNVRVTPSSPDEPNIIVLPAPRLKPDTCFLLVSSHCTLDCCHVGAR